MSISLIFSVGFYRVSATEIQRGILRPNGAMTQIIRNRNSDLLSDLFSEQNDAVETAQSRLKASLMLINLFIFIGGGMLSYFLARRSLRPIEEAHEAQSRFTADASHELRTPIAAMRLENEITLTDDKLTLKKAKDQLLSNIEELDKLTELSEGLLKLARLDNDTLVKENIEIRKLIDGAVERVKFEAEAKKQNIVVKKIVKGKVDVNEAAMIEAIVTILDNAIKYSPKSTEIVVTTNLGKHGLEILITDKGIGINPIDQKRIFDRFYQSDSSRTKGESSGYGIGLSIAKSVVEAHGGSINVDSQINKGSTFTLLIPVK